MNRAFVMTLAVASVVGGAAMIVNQMRSSDASAATEKAEETRLQARDVDSHRPSPTPYLVRTITDLSLHQSERLEAVRNLPGDLTLEEHASVMEILRQPQPERMSASHWYVIINEIMGELDKPRFEHLGGYRKEMADLLSDPHVDPVVRDYAAQYVALSLADVPSSHTSPDFAYAMDSCLSVLTSDREAYTGVTGTILMALCDLYEKLPAGSFSEYEAPLGKAISVMVSGERPTSMSNQISAIQAAGRMSHPEALPSIREYAKGNSANASIRLSSVAALGYFGEADDRAYLQELAASESSLRFAAQEALKRMTR